MLYVVLNTNIMENGLQFESKFFAAPFASSGTKLVTTTEYRPRANSQVEELNKTMLALFRHYIDEHQFNWNTFVKPLVCGYNTQVHRTKNTTPFCLILSRKTPSALMQQKTITMEEYSIMLTAQAKLKGL